MEEEKKSIDFSELIGKIEGFECRFGHFAGRTDKELNVIFEADSGWKIQYPFGTETWAMLANWFAAWDKEENRIAVENFIKILVFPTSVRLMNIDNEYINGIVAAHNALTERMIANAPEDTEEQRQAAIDEMKAYEDFGKMVYREAGADE